MPQIHRLAIRVAEPVDRQGAGLPRNLQQAPLGLRGHDRADVLVAAPSEWCAG